MHPGLLSVIAGPLRLFESKESLAFHLGFQDPLGPSQPMGLLPSL